MAVNDIVMGAAGASGPATFIEDVFSTWLYTGNSSTQTITNGIDLSGKGGLVWEKLRNTSSGHFLMDTARGGNFSLDTASTGAQVGGAGLSFNSNGYTWASSWSSSQQVASWTFREQPKFFDVVTYTGNGANRTIAHNLGSAPGCIIVKITSATSSWNVYHRSLTSAAYQLELNNTGAQFSDPTVWNSTAPTSSVFSLGTNGGVNASGQTYVAYLFAHNAGGFGTSGADNVISCGSVTGGATNAIVPVTLGYEPQFVITKRVDSTGAWQTQDVMRGWSRTSNAMLYPNDSAAEVVTSDAGYPTATGFTLDTTANATYIYIAIRRPMKTPTTGTEVFTPNFSSAGTISVGFPPDWVWYQSTSNSYGNYWSTRLTGNTQYLQPSSASAEANGGANTFRYDQQNSYTVNLFGAPAANHLFKRAAGFFDVVCYTGNGTAGQTYNHNLGVAPELMIIKNRGASGYQWTVYVASLGNTQFLTIRTNAAGSDGGAYWNSTTPTSTVFTVGSTAANNASANTYVAYLFATVANVSKVGSYTGTGATQSINAGLASGARFVMIKRTDDVGDWWVWDTARGMVSGTDPRLPINTGGNQINNNWVYTASTGFQIVTTDASVNASGGSYIYLAIS